MIKWLLCWLWGHRFTEKIPAGQYTQYGFFGDAYNANRYKWQQLQFCHRCGANNPYFTGED